MISRYGSVYLLRGQLQLRFVQSLLIVGAAPLVAASSLEGQLCNQLSSSLPMAYGYRHHYIKSKWTNEGRLNRHALQ
jgi:uncharacterized membrane protein